MKLTKWKDMKKDWSPEQRARVAAEVAKLNLEIDLQKLRDLSGLTQTELADALGTTQPLLSAMENRKDHLLSTLRKYVEALGGELEVVAVIGNNRLRLSSIP